MIRILLELFTNKLPFRFRKHFYHRFVDEDNHLHNLKGPALNFNPYEFVWYKHGFKHRYYGPAVRLCIASTIEEGWFHQGNVIKL